LLVLDGSGAIQEFVGGYSDYARYRDLRNSEARESAARKASSDQQSSGTKAVEKKPRKLSYKDQREFDSLPAKLEALEQEKVELEAAMSKPDFYSQPNAQVQSNLTRITELTNEIEKAYERWSKLDAMVSGS